MPANLCIVGISISALPGESRRWPGGPALLLPLSLLAAGLAEPSAALIDWAKNHLPRPSRTKELDQAASDSARSVHLGEHQSLPGGQQQDHPNWAGTPAEMRSPIFDQGARCDRLRLSAPGLTAQTATQAAAPTEGGSGTDHRQGAGNTLNGHGVAGIAGDLLDPEGVIS